MWCSLTLLLNLKPNAVSITAFVAESRRLFPPSAIPTPHFSATPPSLPPRMIHFHHGLVPEIDHFPSVTARYGLIHGVMAVELAVKMAKASSQAKVQLSEVYMYVCKTDKY